MLIIFRVDAWTDAHNLWVAIAFSLKACGLHGPAHSAVIDADKGIPRVSEATVQQWEVHSCQIVICPCPNLGAERETVGSIHPLRWSVPLAEPALTSFTRRTTTNPSPSWEVWPHGSCPPRGTPEDVADPLL